MKRQLGVCYYPEHWPESEWTTDANCMAALGLHWVRIGEFAWHRIEPRPGDYQWQWLDRAIDVLGAAGLKVVLGTPTATPPRWMLDRYPDMLALDENGQPRGFGSRRHYCFSHPAYLQECRRLVTLIAQRYGSNPHIQGWQTDNEYGCQSKGEVKVLVSNKVFIPTLFTPNGDQINDSFQVFGTGIKSIEWIIYDLNGTPVFRTNSVVEAMQEGWQGNKNVHQCLKVLTYGH